MYYCHKCGKQLADDELYCANCGTKRTDVPERKEERPRRNPADHEHETERVRNTENQNTGSRNSVKILIVVLVLAAAAAAGGFMLYTHNQKVANAGKSSQTTATADTAETESQTAASQNSTQAGNAQNNTKSGSTTGQTTGQTAENDTGSSKPAAVQEKKHEYTVVAQMKTWDEAKSWCESQGGYLATVTSQSEYDTILQKANESGLKVLWLGASRNAAGNFAWVNGEAFSFSAWAQGEPNNDGGSENYLGMMLSNDSWAMYDLPDDVSSYYKPDIAGFVIEKEAAQ